MIISGTFLDEITHDIPVKTGERKKWREDFRIMKAVGIDTITLIRCGHKGWMTYPLRSSSVNGLLPGDTDLVELYLRLAQGLA